ncbi:MAG TPA: DUF4345 domain-containing protein [Allosphingosinicella sp.]|jgi:hypothetical protein|nr:DUF4345 domain-containing protein [Allosphingosinicella sp.]
MRAETERRLLQVSVALACMVPLSMGFLSVLRSAPILRGVTPPLPIDLDSHYRYLSGLLLGIGLTFLASIPRIETRTTVFRTLGFVILIGGLARLLSLVQEGVPGRGHQFGLVMELVVVPLIVVWQARVARRYRPNPT